jgi:DNA-binding winged helix-turn-helix (wHTH) protein/Tol biopolymer transport system component
MTSPTRSSPSKYRFEDLTLDVGQRRVWRGSDALPLTNLTFELLRVLVEAAPNVVSHDELAEKVWGPRRVVTPENLSQRIMVLRDALGDSADQPRYIEGLRGQGYRLIPEVQAASTRGLPDRVSTGESMMTPYVPVPSAKHLTGRKLIYAVAGALLLTLAFIAVNSYLRGATTHDVATASGASPMSEQTLRFVVHAPEGSTFGMAPAQPGPALSPDGKQLVFVAPFESEMILWTQTLGELEARPVMGTNGAHAPFWSPDGDYIAFHAQSRLKRISARGDGSPTDIAVADLPPIRGGTWSADGTIVFAGSEGLYRIPSDGGEAELLTRIDHTRGEFSHRFPVMLPDETVFVYLVLSTQDEYGGLYLGSIDDPDMKIRLMPSDSNAAFGFDSNGRLHLFFVRDSALVAQPFDVSRRALTGDPVVIVSEKIVTAPTVRYAAFAASGRTLVYRPRFAPSTRLVWIDRRGLVGRQIGEEGGRWRFPALSPDGTRLVALREDRNDTSGLWLFDLVRSRRERLARGSWVSEPTWGALMAAWTPDSSEVVYSSAHPSSWSLYRRPVTGAAVEPLFAEPTPAVKRVRDATDDFVLFHDDDNEFWVVPFTSKLQPYRLPIEGEKNHGRVSPDGRWLAYDSTAAGMTEVYVTAFPGPAERWPISTGGGSDPQWRRDGRELYYIAAEQTLMAVSVETDPTFVAGTPEPLFRASFDGPSLAFGSAFAPSPDGQRFLVAEAISEDEPRLIATLNWMPQRQALD